MSAILYQLPPVYKIAFTDGEMDGVVEGYETRKLWEAEVTVFDFAEAYPEKAFWITTLKDLV